MSRQQGIIVRGRSPQQANPAVRKLEVWLSKSSRSGTAYIDHTEINGFDFGRPLIHDEAHEGLSAPIRMRLENVVAVERSVYAGLRSRYLIKRASDRGALLSGLAHGFAPATLRLERESLERCVENDAWRLADCRYWEYSRSAWRTPPASLRRLFDGKSDGRSRWSARIFAPAEHAVGFAAYRLTLVAGTSQNAKRASLLEIDIDSKATARRAALAIANACGSEIPRAEGMLPSAGSPALIWPEGIRVSKAQLARVQLANR
jgi:hypothetical protein